MSRVQDATGMVEWAEFADCARIAFGWWADCDQEVRWAERSWSILNEYGLTSYPNEDEKFRVILRFLALSEIFNDFLYIAWGLDNIPMYADLLGKLGVNRKSVIAFAQADLSWFDKETLLSLLTPSEVELHSVIADLCDKARPELFTALERGCGGINSLFASLWRCNPAYADDSEKEIFSDSNFDISDSFYWLSCERNSLLRERMHCQ